MKKIRILRILAIVALFAIVTVGIVSAEDGVLFRRNVSKTPDQETERANLAHMTFYVPAQTSAGELTTIEYYQAISDTVYMTRQFAKPLVSVYIDGLLEEDAGEASIMSGAGWGAHDAYGALSLDDGATWKRTNLSNSAELSSFNLADGHAYPGDAHNMTFALAGDKILVGWISKYCDGGSPAYTWVDETTGADLYPDIWGVAGSQSSVDYTLQGYPEVGEIPYSCVWAARGTLLPVELDDTGTMGYDIVWTKAERLTSGVRDANRLEMNGDGAAGFMMVWQEDPEGLRPGQGLGPGEGWSGAVVNGKTDLWYSHISLDDFVQVQTSDDDLTPTSIYSYTGETLPKVAAPMALPVRLTDNNMCKATGSKPYCYINFDDVDDDGNLILPDLLPTAPLPDGASTFCADLVEWTTPSGTQLDLCVAQDGRVMQGRVGASRPRVNVQPYDASGDGVYDSAWVILGAEESKALGGGAPDDPGGGQPIEEDPEDMGKNMWYYTFDMLNPDVVQQGLMINQPAKCNPYDVVEKGCNLDEFMLLDDDQTLYPDNQFYETEIARRFSHFSQPIHQFGSSGVAAALIVKQGILNQGGPADIFLRTLKVPDDVWLDCATGEAVTEDTVERCLPAGYNPYAYENLVCEDAEGTSLWAYRTDLGQEANPRYLEGLCLSNMINISGGTIVSCDGTEGDCADEFPWDGVDDAEKYPKVTEWVQTVDNLDDQSWENPYDVAKGHRGFIDGDFILMMYAWAPNWKANTVGNDHYNLYARRSFDGGETWTTTPADWADGGYTGTTTCENYGAGSEYNPVCTTYGAGDFEQARNLSQLTGNKVTILDPRYSPTGGIKMLPITDKYGLSSDLPYTDDATRDPSKFFIVYETGDNTTVAEGEAVPLDLFYSRAINWGDDYDLVEYTTGGGETVEGFDWLEHDREDLSGEAANTSNPGGTFYYVIWNQWQEHEEDGHEVVTNSDAIFRRLMFVEDESARPIVQILYVSNTMPQYGDTLLLVGSARDGDQVGGLPLEDIAEVVWTDTFDGVTTVIDDGDDDPKRLNYPVRNLQPGWHQMGFKAKDNGGNWSPGVTVGIRVYEVRYDIFLPVSNNPNP